MAIHSIEQAIADALISSAEVGALISGRVYPVTLPPGATLPALVYRRIESVPQYTLQGYGSESVTLALESFAETYAEVKELAFAVRGVMTAVPFMAMVMKEADVRGENGELPCVRTEYLVQQTGG